jgi:hypothetical protein
LALPLGLCAFSWLGDAFELSALVKLCVAFWPCVFLRLAAALKAWTFIWVGAGF